MDADLAPRSCPPRTRSHRLPRGSVLGTLVVASLVLLAGEAWLLSGDASTPAPQPGSTHRMGPAAGSPLVQAEASLRAAAAPAPLLRAEALAPHPGAAPLVGSAVSLAYDASDGYVLAAVPNVTVSGNGTGWGSVVQTWTFLHGNWTQLPISYAPPNRGFGAMVYDPVDGYIVLFGGTGYGGPYGFAGYLNDTWTYHNGTWTNLTGTTVGSPEERAYAQVTWDASDGYALLAGGLAVVHGRVQNATDWWGFVGGNWTQLGTSWTLPAQGSMTYDAADGYVVYFGGAFVTSFPNETVSYHAGTWRYLTPNNAPSGRAFASMTYDPNLGAVLLFGGYSAAGYLNDTWSYNNLTWTLLSASSGPSPRDQAQLTYDAADNETILFGGGNTTNSSSETWAFVYGANGSSSNGSSWSQAAPRFHDSTTVSVVNQSLSLSLFGVQGTSASYRYAGLPPGCPSVDAAWLNCTPTRSGNYTVRATATTSTGTSSAQALVRIVEGPSIAAFEVVPELTEVGAPVNFSAAIVTDGVATFQLSYGGLPKGCASQDSPNLACTPGAAGNFTVELNLSYGPGVQAQAFVNLSVAPNPSVGTFSLSPATIDLGQSATLEISASGGLGGLSYAYAGLPPGCAPSPAPLSSGPTFLCQPNATGSFPVVGLATDTWGFSAQRPGLLTVNPDPKVAQFTSSASEVEVNATVTLTAAATGGTGAYSYGYSALPPGCTSANVPTLVCVPTAPGSYLPVVTVTDAAGVSSSATLLLEVTPATLPPGSGSHGGPQGGGGSGSTGTSAGPSFFVGLGLGLVVLVVGAALLLWRARRRQDAEELVEALRRGSVQGVVGPPSSVSPPRRGPPGGAA